MREQPTKVTTGAAKSKAAVFLVSAVTVMLAAAVIFAIRHTPPYKPPPFEKTAIRGVPNPNGDMGYSEIDAMGKFKFSLAAVMYQQSDGSLLVYFTNPEINSVYLMCEINGKNGAALYKSGLIRPGEYVERLKPAGAIKNEAVEIKINVYAFNPENFQSAGTAALNNILQPY